MYLSAGEVGWGGEWIATTPDDLEATAGIATCQHGFLSV